MTEAAIDSQAFPTVQEGIDAAQPEEEVWVAKGLYTGTVTIAKGIKLIGGFKGNEYYHPFRIIPEYTVLDGQRKGSVLRAEIPEHQTLRIEGFTIRNGTGTITPDGICGGGIFSILGTTVVHNNFIELNGVYELPPATTGGGVYLKGVATVVTGNRIEKNMAGNGAGLFTRAADNRISDNLVRNNFATVNSGGGGVVCTGERITVTGNWISGNSGCGLYSYGGTVFISGNRVMDNSTEESAGWAGIQATGDAVEVTGNLVEGNHGSGCAVWESSVVIHGNSFRSNGTHSSGAALESHRCVGAIRDNEFIENWSARAGGAIHAWGDSVLSIADNTFRGNIAMADSAPADGGGAMDCSGHTVITENWIASNQSGAGAGIFVTRTSLIANNVLISNTPVPQHNSGRRFGGGIAATGSSLILNNTFVDNAHDQGGTVWADGTIEFANNVMAFNLSGLEATSSSTVTLRHNLSFANAEYDYKGIPDSTGHHGNLHQDPLFVNREAGDFRLLSGSPAIDAGDNAFVLPRSKDLAGGARLLDGDGDGVPVLDIGAYEFDPALVPFTLYEAAHVLRITGGLEGSTYAERMQYDLVQTFGLAGVLEIQDVLTIARKAAGLEPNP